MSITRLPDIRLLLAAVSLLLLAACSRDAGPPVTEPRGVDAFHSIDLRTAARMDVEVGPAARVTLTAPAGLLAKVTTRVENEVLVIDAQNGLASLGGRDLQVRITLPELKSLAVNGAGDVVLRGVRGEGLSLVVQGAGKVVADGEVQALNARLNGAGELALARVRAVDATVLVNGAGSLTTTVTGSLQAEVNGVGSITYAGNPQQVDSRINGVGRITPDTSASAEATRAAPAAPAPPTST